MEKEALVQLAASTMAWQVVSIAIATALAAAREGPWIEKFLADGRSLIVREVDGKLIVREVDGKLTLCVDDDVVVVDDDDVMSWSDSGSVAEGNDCFEEYGTSFSEKKPKQMGTFAYLKNAFFRLLVHFFLYHLTNLLNVSSAAAAKGRRRRGEKDERLVVGEKEKEEEQTRSVGEEKDEEEKLLAEGFERLASFEAITFFEDMWTTNFYETFLTAEKENPTVDTWETTLEHTSSRTVLTFHPLGIPLPRWCGLSGLAIPTTKKQRKHGNLVREDSQFQGFPFASAMSVQTAWLYKDKTMRLFYKCAFDDNVPTWIRTLVRRNSKDEIFIVNERMVNFAKTIYKELPTSLPS